MDYDIWYKGIIIGNCQAETSRKATNLARKMFKGGTAITVTQVPRDVNKKEGREDEKAE